jgi:hypothetical protein
VSLLTDIIGGLAKPLADTIDNVHTSEEEKLTLKGKFFELQVALYSKVMEYEGKLADAQAKIITAEAESESWIARNWRPLTMIVFVALVVNRWTGLSVLLGVPQVMVPHDIELKLWDAITLGLGGYIAGRSLEKIAPSVAEAIGNLKK